jgi:hypothetical protein
MKERQLKAVNTFSYLGSGKMVNGKIQKGIIKRHHRVNGFLRNKDINEKCKLNILKMYFKRILTI